jgi:hypothetical protein
MANIWYFSAQFKFRQSMKRVKNMLNKKRRQYEQDDGFNDDVLLDCGGRSRSG